MTNLHQAHRQWASREADERFLSLTEMLEFKRSIRDRSRQVDLTTRSIRAVDDDGDPNVFRIETHDGSTFEPTNWSFSQLARVANAPAHYLRNLPGYLAADCLNHGWHVQNESEPLALLTMKETNEVGTLRAATSTSYGRIWDHDVIAALVDRFGDGVTGRWKVPGEFGRNVAVTRDNTTLYASDRDMFVFLADESRTIEVPSRRGGEAGQLSRGFFVWNSETGARSLGVAFFLFDYVCSNRIVWGARDYREIRVRHSSGAPDRWTDEFVPVLEDFSKSSDAPIVKAITDARERDVTDHLDAFLGSRFGTKVVELIKANHERDEGRPIETAWDAVVGATAYARTIQHQDERVRVEKLAGQLLEAA